MKREISSRICEGKSAAGGVNCTLRANTVASSVKKHTYKCGR
jgi:hypothetical protein